MPIAASRRRAETAKKSNGTRYSLAEGEGLLRRNEIQKKTKSQKHDNRHSDEENLNCFYRYWFLGFFHERYPAEILHEICWKFKGGGRDE